MMSNKYLYDKSIFRQIKFINAMYSKGRPYQDPITQTYRISDLIFVSQDEWKTLLAAKAVDINGDLTDLSKCYVAQRLEKNFPEVGESFLIFRDISKDGEKTLSLEWCCIESVNIKEENEEGIFIRFSDNESVLFPLWMFTS